MHSLRKGTASYVSSGSTRGQPQGATNIRAGWMMGQIQDTYLRFEAAGDQYVVHVVSGLPICSPKFAVLPPQFDCCVIESDEITKIVMPSIPTGLKNAGRFLSASLIFHLDTLESYLHSSHPLLHSSFLTTDKLMEMRNSIVLKYAWEEEDGSSSAVAVVGSTVAAVGELSGLESTNQSFEDPSLAAIEPMPLRGNVINEEFDKREVGHSTFQVQKQVQDMLASFEANVITKLDGLSGEGSSSLTHKNNSSTPTNTSGGK